MRRCTPVLLLSPICLLLLACPPGITFSPQSGLPGTIVEIRGAAFDPDPFNNVVTIGGGGARVISGDATHLRVVALRDIATGPIEVQIGAATFSSATDFTRAGTTTLATPLADSDAELVEGFGTEVDRRFDMSAQGVGQKVLVVLAQPSDIDPEDLAPAGSTARAAIVAKTGDVNTFFTQASYNLLSAAFTATPDWIPLSQTRDFYAWQQEDIDRAQAALDALELDPSSTAEQIEEARQKLLSAQNAQGFLQEPAFLFAEALIGARAAVADFDSFTDFLVIVAGPFLRGQCCWRETGFHAESTRLGLNFDIDFAGQRGLTYVSQGADWGRMAHELSHFFASGDLYAQGSADGTFTEGSAGPFAMMGNHDSHPLYIGYNLEKYLNYYNEDPANGNVKFLEWGSVPDHNQTYDLLAHTKTQDAAGNGVFHLLRLQVTEGLTYYAEVRQRPDAAAGPAADYIFDPSIPLDPSNPPWQGGVIIFKAVENNNQNNNRERPVSLLPPARMLQVGDSFDDPARTIRLSVVQRLADRPAKYRVRVEWGHLPAADPNGQFDLRIRPWSPPPWESPDIWANSPKNDETAPPKIIYKNHEPGDETKPIGNGDPPWVGRNNTLFARIRNEGSVPTPEAVKVTFYVNTPPGVGDNGSWAPFDTVDVGVLAAGETRTISAGVPWRPAVGEHTCAKVQIHSMTGEITFDNNQAQENFSEFETAADSPYRPVEFDVQARNPYDAPVVMDLKARNVPQEWFVALDHGSVWLPPLAEKTVHVVIWTDRIAEWATDDRPRESPRKPLIDIEGWIGRWGDQFFATGGVTAFVQAVRRVEVEIDVRGENTQGQPLHIDGRVVPATGAAPIAIHVVDPAGRLHSERTETDPGGVFSHTTRFLLGDPGIYKVQAHVLGGTLASQAESPVVEVTLP